MDKEKATRVIRHLERKDLLDFLLSICNLNRKELRLIEERVRQGLSQEEYAEDEQISVSTVKKIENTAFTKIIRNWNGIDFTLFL